MDWLLKVRTKWRWPVHFEETFPIYLSTIFGMRLSQPLVQLRSTLNGHSRLHLWRMVERYYWHSTRIPCHVAQTFRLLICETGAGVYWILS
jgi:hypothetical protein